MEEGITNAGILLVYILTPRHPRPPLTKTCWKHALYNNPPRFIIIITTVLKSNQKIPLNQVKVPTQQQSMRMCELRGETWQYRGGLE